MLIIKSKKFIIFTSLIILIFVSCKTKSQTETTTLFQDKDSLYVDEFIVECEEFTRDSIKYYLNNKISNSEPFYVHIFVPLCDDINQGIVPTNSSLGDGMNLKTNLYWGAGYGIKTHFKRLKGWKLIKDTFDIDDNILERVVFEKTFSNNAKVYLIADAYRGDRMQACLKDYLNSLAVIRLGIQLADTETIKTHGNADFLIFNGHNGLMDVFEPIKTTIDNRERDAAVIACVSQSYFLSYFECSKSYPLVTTTSLLPPEAYVAEAVINSWAEMKSEEEIRLSAGNAMARVRKKPQKAMRKMFATGW